MNPEPTIRAAVLLAYLDLLDTIEQPWTETGTAISSREARRYVIEQVRIFAKAVTDAVAA